MSQPAARTSHPTFDTGQSRNKSAGSVHGSTDGMTRRPFSMIYVQMSHLLFVRKLRAGMPENPEMR
jgi:hypothetical protein